ncbi:uncharacterized protein LOC106092009 [Stomoxys calcitrans]|nr:uncharacterized protein LOC106092009 [Stomoxys calcitrans]
MYSVVKEFQGNLRFRLFVWYLTSVVMGHSWFIIFVNFIWNYDGMELVTRVIGVFGSYFNVTIFLSMNVICFEVWITFKELWQKNEKIRYVVYAIYVWGVPMMLFIVNSLERSRTLCFCVVMFALFSSFVTFTCVVCHIIRIRIRIMNAETAKSVIVETTKTLCRLFIMMGMPRILLFIPLYVCREIYFAIFLYTFLALEAPLIFKLFVLKEKPWSWIKSQIMQSPSETKSLESSDIQI